MKKRNIVVKAVTFVLFGLLIASFAVWGIGDVFRSPGQTRGVAEVGDVQIEQQEFSRALSREMNRLSARFGGRLDLDQARALGLPDQILGQMIGRALFDQKGDDLGLVVTKEQINRRIVAEPAFHNELGQFDRSRFVQALQISSLSEQEYVEALRREILRQQIASALTEAVAAPDTLARIVYGYREERRIARVLVVPNASVTDLPEPDEPALQAFHKEFSDRFMAPEYRAVGFVWLRAEDLAAEIAVSEVDLSKEFDVRREDFVIPERRRVEQIVLPDQAAALQAADRLTGGADLAAVAGELTGGPPIDLGLVERDALPAELSDVVFALDQGSISEPVESALGWHILRVTAIEPRREPALEEVREELARDVAMSRAVDSMISIANQLDDELAAGAPLEEAAAQLNLPLRRIDAIDQQGKGPDGALVPDLPGDRFVEIAFETAAGDESLLTETAEGGYFILRVDGVTPARLRPLDEVRDQVAALWRNAQRAERTHERAKALTDRVQRGEELEAVAKAEGYQVVTTEPVTRFETDPARSPSPSLPAKLFQLAPGKVATVSAPDGYLVAQLTEIQPADPASDAAAAAELRDSLAQAMRGDILEQFMATLREEYGVEINQRLFEDVLSGF